jgi:hypothetical protein
MTSLLNVLSRLGPVTVVKDSPFSIINWPHFCWVSTKELSHLTPALLARYPGKGSWTVVSDHPRVCLVVQPSFRRGESYAEFDELAKRIGTDKGDLRSNSSPDMKNEPSFRTEMIREIPNLASFIEGELNLESKPSLGVHFSTESFELPFMEDHAGQGGSIILALDPAEFVRTRLSTSPFDRAIHFWLTEEEERELYLETSTSGSPSMPLLMQVAQSGFGGLILPPGQMAQLATESAALKLKTSNYRVHAALDKLLSICRSAEYYHLGIYIPGE